MARVVLNLGSPKATAIPAQINTGKHSSNTSAFTVKPLLKEKVEGKEKKAQKGLDNSDNIEGIYLPYRLKYRRLGRIRRFWRRFLPTIPTCKMGDSRSIRRMILPGM